ncbi:hypothetical protein niasHS_014138 [Heterodera schachtii]|uniref:Uncharacterized protein n=1 Tax=Heterodera schachtii TaxID=97005 RepID=A0ABD2IQW4_HETSC
MPCQLPNEIATVTDDVFSYMCNLAMEKCSKKADKKKASCGGAAMRKRLLIKNFVAQMLAQDRHSRELSSPTSDCSSHLNQTFDESFDFPSCQSGANAVDQFGDDMEMDAIGEEVPSNATNDAFLCLDQPSSLLTDLDDVSCDPQQQCHSSRSRKRPWSLVFSADATATGADAVPMPSLCSMGVVVDQYNHHHLSNTNNNSVVDMFTAATSAQHHHFINTTANNINNNGVLHSSAPPLLSPLCCGMLQMSPFGSATAAGEAMLLSGGVGSGGAGGVGTGGRVEQPMLKRVKL